MGSLVTADHREEVDFEGIVDAVGVRLDQHMIVANPVAAADKIISDALLSQSQTIIDDSVSLTGAFQLFVGDPLLKVQQFADALGGSSQDQRILLF